MSNSMIILCPGQGAQSIGMGKAWVEAHPAAKETFDEADAALADVLGESLSHICFEGPVERLNGTDVCQPALYTCAIACFRAMKAELGGIEMASTSGLSLGEYTALHLAGAFSFVEGLHLVAKRGQYMQEASTASDSSMVALIGADESQADEVCSKAAGDDVLVPANFNAPGQIVISGHRTACERALEVAGEMGLRATALAVAGAFHSPLMEPAAQRMGEALASIEFKPLSCTVVSNVTAEPHDGTDPESIRRLLVDQITSPVRWAQSCDWMGKNLDGMYHEMAPGKVLMGLMRRINRQIKVTPHDTPA